MSDRQTLERRLAAVERALTDCDATPADVADAAAATDRIDALEDRVGDLETQVADLEAAVRALRGYVGNVRSVNRDVEDTAEQALRVARSASADEDGKPDPGEWTLPADGGDEETTDREDPPASEWDWDAFESDEADEGSTAPGEGQTETEPGAERRSGAETPVTESEPRTSGRQRSGGPTGDQRDPDRGGSNQGSGGRPGETWGTNAWPGRESATGGESGDAAPSESAWPPEGMDVERAQPWSAPDIEIDREDAESEEGILDRVREALAE